jgi:tetratricopeptide (TPR) repeat protein
LASTPKTYYFGPAQEMRARIYARNGKMKNALAALKAVTDAEGMNARDYFSAKYLSTWLSKTLGANSIEKWTAAEKAYRALLRELEGHPRNQLAQVPRFRVLMSLGEALRGTGKAAEARKVFDQILGEANDATDKGVLAGVYYGLGDSVFEEATRLQAQSGSGASKDQIKALLNQAALHYLRVVYHYGEHAGQRELFGATQGAARVFRSLFTLSGEEDCVAGRRAYDFYRQATDMQQQGEERRILIGEGLALKERLDAKCK